MDLQGRPTNYNDGYIQGWVDGIAKGKAEADAKYFEGLCSKYREDISREMRYRGLAEADNRRLIEEREKLQEGVRELRGKLKTVLEEHGLKQECMDCLDMYEELFGDQALQQSEAQHKEGE